MYSWCVAFLTLGVHVQRGLQYLVSPSVRLSVTTFSATVCNEVAKKRYKWVQRYTGFIGDFRKKCRVLKLLCENQVNKPIY